MEGDFLTPEKIYYEPAALSFPQGQALFQKYGAIPWIPVESHNNIEELRKNPNSAFPKMKRFLVVGIRKTHRYVENHKVSDFLVPYTSSGCSAMCLYCYLVCNYNKCAYLRLFVNREEMLAKLVKTAAASDKDLVFEIGSNSDLVLENEITENLPWTIENFSKQEKGYLTFPTKFASVAPLLPLSHRGRIIFRMSVNPSPVIRAVEFGTANLESRIRALNEMCAAGYKCGLLLAPVVLTPGWEENYRLLIEELSDRLSPKAKRQTFLEIIFMTYSFVHRAINEDAFPNAVRLFDPEMMTGRGRGKYCYRDEIREKGEAFLRAELAKHLPDAPILYVV